MFLPKVNKIREYLKNYHKYAFYDFTATLFVKAAVTLQWRREAGASRARAPAEKACAPAVPRRTKWAKINNELTQRLNDKLQ